MKTIGKKNCFVVLLVLLFNLFAAIFSNAEENGINKTLHLKRTAVLPFQAVMAKTELSNTVACPLCGAVYFGGKIAEGGEKVVEELFIEKLKDIKEIEILPQEKVDGIYKRVNAESLKMTLPKIISKTGKELDADVVAVGYVFRYMERIGYEYSAEKPASVAFEINLINPNDGSIIWKGVFDKTQKSLMEDVFHVSSLKWLTARELAKQGMNQVFKTFPVFEY
ncbi:MAG: hypothetical protein ABFD50_11740 [Smithella sp.]